MNAQNLLKCAVYMAVLLALVAISAGLIKLLEDL